MAKKKSMNWDILLSVSFSLGAKILTFFQSVVVSWQYGAQRTTDILFYAVGIITTCSVICSTVNQQVIVPNLIKLREKSGEESAMRFGTLVFIVYFLTAGVLSAVLAAFPVEAFSFLSKFEHSALLENASVLRIIAPTLLLMVINTLITDIFTAYKYFTMPMVVDGIKSLLIIVIVLLPWQGGSIIKLSQAILIANVLQLVFLLITMRVILKWRPRYGKTGLDRSVGANISYVVVGQVIVFLAGIILMYLVSGFEDGIYTAMDYAQKINTVIATVVISQLTTIVGINIIEYYHSGQHEILSELFGRYLRVSFYMITPVCFVLAMCAKPLISVLFERGEFGAEASANTAQFFMIFILIIPFRLISDFVNRLIIARQIQRTSLVWKIINNVAIMLFAWLMVGLFGYVGAPLGQLIGTVLYCVFLFIVLGKYFPFIQHRGEIVGFLIKNLLVNAGLSLVLGMLFNNLMSATGLFAKLLSMLLAGGAYFAVYLLLSLVPGLFRKELTWLWNTVRRKGAAQS
ncbi:MAG: murein biosynthesis integral membrane protein MurJ [Oscillospiraceae bacterium]